MQSLFTSEIGNRLLERAADLFKEENGDTLRITTRLRKEFLSEPGFIRQAVELALLRQKAGMYGYGQWAASGFFTRQSLEQATAPEIARHHARRFRSCRTILEICTGAGFDTAALAEVAERVISIEVDTVLAEMARHNLSLQGRDNVEILCGTAEDILPSLDLSLIDGLWCDPSRRDAAGRRKNHPEEYMPPLSFLMNIPVSKVRGIKVAPALNIEHLPEGWAREWIGFRGECREQVLWRDAPVIEATVSLVDAGCCWFPIADTDPKEILWNKSVEELAGAWLVEPHPALIRSGALTSLLAEDCFLLLDEHIAYTISLVSPSPSPFYQSFRILEAFSYSFKRLKSRIQALGWGSRTEIKKRGFPDTPEEVRAKLRLPQSEKFGVVILTRIGTGHTVILAERE